VPEAVDLHDEPGRLPERVQPPAPALRVPPLGLPVRLRNPVVADKPAKVELRQRLSSAGDVGERRARGAGGRAEATLRGRGFVSD
jgi:hypothetical protein